MTVGRFAPSPSGKMHLGNLFSFLMAWCSARAKGGEIVLRMEDLDPQRTGAEYAALIRRDLLRFGLDWDREVPCQSVRTAAYDEAFARLAAMGLVYPCYCSRAEVHAASAPHLGESEYVYPGTCRNLTPAERAAKTRRPAWRLRVPAVEWTVRDGLQGDYTENLERDCGDFVIRRADGVYAYQLAVVVDDADNGVTEVVRGRDLLSSARRGSGPGYAFAAALPGADHRQPCLCRRSHRTQRTHLRTGAGRDLRLEPRAEGKHFSDALTMLETASFHRKKVIP